MKRSTTTSTNKLQLKRAATMPIPEFQPSEKTFMNYHLQYVKGDEILVHLSNHRAIRNEHSLIVFELNEDEVQTIRDKAYALMIHYDTSYSKKLTSITEDNTLFLSLKNPPIFNEMRQQIDTLPMKAFMCKVIVKMMGIKRKDKEISPLMGIKQIMVMAANEATPCLFYDSE